MSIAAEEMDRAAAGCPRYVQWLVLHLVLTHHWFDEVASGRKSVEYREMSAHWCKQIGCRASEITHVRFSRGYTKTTLTFPVYRIDVGKCPIPGWDGDYFRIHFLQNVKWSEPGDKGATSPGA